MKHKLKLKSSFNPPINKKETLDYVAKGSDQIETVLQDIMERSKRSLSKHLHELNNDDIRHIQLCKSFYAEMNKAGQTNVVNRLDAVMKAQQSKGTFGDFLNNTVLQDIVEHNQNGVNRCGIISNTTLFTVDDLTLTPEDIAYLTKKNITRTVNIKTGNVKSILPPAVTSTAAGTAAGAVAAAVASARPAPVANPTVSNKTNLNWILWVIFFLVVLLIALVSLILIRKKNKN